MTSPDDRRRRHSEERSNTDRNFSISYLLIVERITKFFFIYKTIPWTLINKNDLIKDSFLYIDRFHTQSQVSIQTLSISK